MFSFYCKVLNCSVQYSVSFIHLSSICYTVSSGHIEYRKPNRVVLAWQFYAGWPGLVWLSLVGVYTVEPVYNGHLGTRYIWPLYTGGCYRENLYKVVSSILVVMAVINE